MPACNVNNYLAKPFICLPLPRHKGSCPHAEKQQPSSSHLRGCCRGRGCDRRPRCRGHPPASQTPVLKPADALTAPGMRKKPLGRARTGSPTANGGRASPAMLAGWRRSVALASASFGHGALGSAGVGQTGLTILGEPKTLDKP